ncbi:MAG: DinB family protein [Bacillota bacterium]|nr:DinB family protein [Bacillota bacterium]
MDVKRMIRRWESSRAAMRKLAHAVPQGKEGFRPAEGSMSVGEMILHVLSGEKTAVDAFTVTPGVWEWQTGLDIEHYPTIGSIIEAMDRQTGATRAHFLTLSDADLAQTVKLPWGAEWTLDDLWYEWTVHEIHHRGSIITALRMIGTAPPNLY